MLLPKKLSRKDLEHPKNERSKFNGDLLRKEESFNTRVTRVEGTKQPSNLKNPKGHVPAARAMQPLKEGQVFDPAFRRVIPEKKPLTDRQKKMLKR